MAHQFGGIVDGAAQVAVQDVVVAAARAQEGAIPGNRTDASIMPAQSPNQSVLYSVPDLELASVCSNREKRAITAPLDACYAILRAEVTKLRHSAVRGLPEVDAGAEADSEDVLR